MPMKKYIEARNLKVFKNEVTINEFKLLQKATGTYKLATKFFSIKTKPDDEDMYYKEVRKLKYGKKTTYKLKEKHHNDGQKIGQRWSITKGTRIKKWVVDEFAFQDLAVTVFYLVTADKIKWYHIPQITGQKLPSILKRKSVLLDTISEAKNEKSYSKLSGIEKTKAVMRLLFSPKTKNPSGLLPIGKVK